MKEKWKHKSDYVDAWGMGICVDPIIGDCNNGMEYVIAWVAQCYGTTSLRQRRYSSVTHEPLSEDVEISVITDLDEDSTIDIMQEWQDSSVDYHVICDGIAYSYSSSGDLLGSRHDDAPSTGNGKNHTEIVADGVQGVIVQVRPVMSPAYRHVRCQRIVSRLVSS